MLHDLLHPKRLISPDGRTELIEARFRDTLGFISASWKIERELRSHRYEATRRPQGYHVAMTLPFAAIMSFVKSPWHRLQRQPEAMTPDDYRENFCIHDKTRRLIVGIATLQREPDSGAAEIRVFASSKGYRDHPENTFRLLARLARDRYAATEVEVVTDRPHALSRYGFIAKDGKPLRRNAPNWMVAPIEKILTP